MKKYLAVIIAAAALFVSCAGSGDSCQSGVAPLKVEGTKLYAEGCDTPVAFRGISFGWHNLWPRFYNGDALANLHKDWGAKCFRASIGADTLGETLNGSSHHPGYIEDPEGALKCLFAVIDGAIANDCYILVDWHSHVLHPEEAKAFFTAVATKYKGVPNVIYELFNEPVSRASEEGKGYVDLGDQEAMAAYWRDLKAYGEELIKVITDIDDSNPLILMSCPCWAQRIDLVAADPITTYDNLMYVVHFYAGTHKESLRNTCDDALKAGIPIFISECAACEASGDGPMDPDSWQAWSDWATANDISLLTWSVADKNETCSFFYPAASSEGPWTDDLIKPWGKVVKDWINAK